MDLLSNMLFAIEWSLVMTSILCFIWGIAGLDGQGRKEAEICIKISPVFVIIALILAIIFK